MPLGKTLSGRATLPPPSERRSIRERVGISAAELAVSIGVSPATIYNWEAGTRSPQGLQRAAYAAALEKLTASKDDA